MLNALCLCFHSRACRMTVVKSALESGSLQWKVTRLRCWTALGQEKAQDKSSALRMNQICAMLRCRGSSQKEEQRRSRLVRLNEAGGQQVRFKRKQEGWQRGRQSMHRSKRRMQGGTRKPTKTFKDGQASQPRKGRVRRCLTARRRSSASSCPPVRGRTRPTAAGQLAAATGKRRSM